MTRLAITIAGESQRARAVLALANAPLGTRVTFAESRRSLDQNARLWAMLGDISRQVVWYGNKLNAGDWKVIFTASLRKCRVVPGLDAGTAVPLGLSTSDMTVREMGDLITLIEAFGAERGVVFLDNHETFGR